VQPQSGVQRFATEATAALIRRAAARGDPAPVILTPAKRKPAETSQGFTPVQVGRLSGQAWEQIDLARHAPGKLLNLGNTAPLRHRDQLVVIHDAGVFRSPLAYSRSFRLWYKVLQSLLVRGRARIATVSEASRADIATHLRCPAAHIALVSESGEHMKRLVPDPTILQRAGLQPGRYVLAVGNLAVHKNLPALVETASQLAARGMTLAITGGLDTTIFEATRTALPAPAAYLGRVSDEALAALYQSAACFVFPSLYEGFGLPALEAMTLGCPVVAARIPSLVEICGDAAIFCDPTNPTDIAAAIDRLVISPATQAELRAKGLARAACFSWDRTATQLLEALEG
jgi:glycosyltransferase involved in cell wall biosynthesis